MSEFSKSLIHWQKQYGRHNLPWQMKDPYARWISEVMLQQTQVTTVIDYYCRFMTCFPTVKDLANASEDQVMIQWAGLGYYSRARNLHKAAQIIVDQYGGVFPKTRCEWEQLPGIGRSTASAIVAFSYGEREAILDGNVKRVLTRYFAINRVLDHSLEKELWLLAESLLPADDMDSYTQGLMDLGATVCSKKPQCLLCPFEKSCLAHQNGIEKDLPVPRVKRKRSQTTRTFFLFWYENQIFLEKRTGKSVWQGLYCLPEIDAAMSDKQVQEYLDAQGLSVRNWNRLETLVHDFSHYRLHIEPIAVLLRKTNHLLISGKWVEAKKISTVAMPTPIENLVTKFLSL